MKKLLTLLFLTAFALVGYAEVVASGYCGGEGDGTNLKWELTDAGTLTISGTGIMRDYWPTYEKPKPWHNYRTEIEDVSLQEGVTSIGYRAFNGCEALTSVVIPEGVTSIGGFAFEGCAALTSVVIPEGVTSIGGSAFAACTALEKIEVSAANTAYISIDGVLFNKARTELIQYPAGKKATTYTIPSSVTSIGSSAFRGCAALESVVIPEGVTSIGGSAFGGCDALTSVVIPEGVTSIGGSAFSGCAALTSIEIPSSVTSIGEHAFSYCDALTSVVIPEGVTSIGSFAFDNCGSLTSVVIPEGVTSIGSYAFDNCAALTSIEIPSSVTEIGYHAFSGCDALTSVVILEGVTSIESFAFDNCAALERVEIPSSVTSIGDYAFNDCYSLTSVVIPEGVTSIGDRAFDGCGSMENIEVSAANTAYSSLDGVLFNKDKSELIQYPNGKKATTYTIPEGVTSIGDETFLNCTALTSVEIPSSVTSIGDGAFSGCAALTSMVIPEGVTSIGENAFLNCTALTSVEIPSSVTSIGYRAFYDCTSLKSVVIPSSVTRIGDYAFSGCSSLKSIISLNPEPPECNSSTFYGVDKDIPVYVYDARLYKVAIGWSGFSNYVAKILDSGECGAYGDNLLWSISVDSVFTITGSGNMQNYTADNPSPWDHSFVKNIVVEAGAATIGTYAFSGCDNLESVVFPENLLSIGTNAFEGCGRLQQVEMKSGGISIGSSAFANCTQLKSVVLPAEMRSIGNNAFDNCFSIERIVSYNTVPPTVGANGAFAEVPIYTPVYVPQANMYDYLSASGWNYFFNFQPIDKLWSGVCGSENDGSNLSWELDRETGVLSVSGSGSMADYNGAATPWYAGDIREIVIAEGATTIGAGAFIGCTALENVEIAATVTEIGEYAFAGCGAIGEMICKNLVPPTCVGNAGGSLRNSSTGNYDGVFDGIDPAIPVYVPAESIELYRNAEGWDYFTNFLPIPDDEEDDEQGTFVEKTSDVEASVYARDGMIYCDGVAEFEIYNLVGQEVSNKNGSLKGMYIVVAGEEVLKLMVD